MTTVTPRTSPASAARGSALVETALLLPVYCLLVVGVLYFASAAVLQQELPLIARFYAETAGMVPDSTSPAAVVPITGGASFPDGTFVLWNGVPAVGYMTESPFTSETLRDELVKVSWNARQIVMLDPKSGQMSDEIQVALTREGRLIYDGDILGRVQEMSDEANRWYLWRRVDLSTTHDATLYGQAWGYTPEWGLAGLDPPTLTARVASAVRAASEAGLFTRSLGHDYVGDHPAGYLMSAYWGGPFPVAGYPGYGGSDPFWAPN